MAPDEVRAAWQRESQLRETYWHQAVEAMTAAARMTRTSAGGQVNPADFADFLVSAVAAVAANLGGVEAPTAGRPGSWESDLVHQMIAGALGYEPRMSDLLAHRTEPIRVPLNVAQLVEDSGAIPTLYEAENALPEGEAGDAHFDELRAQYRGAYERYAAAFAQAAQAYALTLEGLAVERTVGEPPTLRVPVQVVVETDPYDGAWTSGVHNPEEFEGDEVAWRIWEGARERAGLPTIETQNV